MLSFIVLFNTFQNECCLYVNQEIFTEEVKTFILIHVNLFGNYMLIFCDNVITVSLDKLD